MKISVAPRVRRLALLTVAGVSFCLWGCSEDTPSSPQQTVSTPPSPTASIQISSPPRGGMVQDGTLDVSPITVSGTACDSVSAVTSLTIGGQPVALSGSPPCLDFTTQLDSRWGLNIIGGTATNKTGYKTTIAQSYLRGPDYFAPAAQSASMAGAAAAEKVPSGVYAQLNQALVDDGDRSDLDDLTTLIGRALGTIDLNTGVPNPIVVTPDFNEDGQVDSHNCDCLWPIPDITVHSTGYRVGRGTIQGSWLVNYVRLASGGIATSFSMNNLSMPVSVSGYLDPTCVVACVTRDLTSAFVTGTVGANAINIATQVAVSLGSDGHPQVSICPSCITVDLVNPWLDIDWGLLEFLDGPIGLGAIETAIVDGFRGSIESAIEDALRDTLVPVIAGFLDAFELPPTVTLPPPMNTVLDIASVFDVIDISGSYPQGVARLGFAVSVSPASPQVTSPFGPIRRGGAVPAFSATEYALGVGLKDDLLNQFLWAAWRGGALEIQGLSGSGLGCIVPGGLETSMYATLPPVVMPGTNGHQIDIGIGDVYIEASLPANAVVAAGAPPAADVAFYVSTIVGASLDIDPATDRLLVTLEADPEVFVQIVRAPEDADLDLLAAQYRDLFDCALSKLVTDILGAIPLPSPPIGSLGLPGIPADARWGLGNGTVDRQDPHTTITGNVVVK